jgi:FKBP-type peptidyl-prolyl cis-trans isomerase
LKLKNLCVAAVALLAACSTNDGVTNPLDIGPPPPLAAGIDTITTASGLKFADVVVGTGNLAEGGSIVAVHYTGWLSTGTAFDTSEGGLPIQFTLGMHQVIPGFEEGIVGMKVGGTRRLIIPPALGYGSTDVRDPSTGRVVIPANSTLIFDVRLTAEQ